MSALDLCWLDAGPTFISNEYTHISIFISRWPMRWTRCPFEIKMRWDEADEMGKMADAECLRLEIPAGGVDEIKECDVETSR